MHHDPLTLAAARCARQIRRRWGRSLPAAGIVLGSGFQPALDAFEIRSEIPLPALTGFPVPAVPGHQPRLLLAELEGWRVLLLAGRAHFYEGHAMAQATFPIRVLAQCGVRQLLLTSAAGAIHRKFRPGNFAIISDHINLMGENPLRGVSPAAGACFVDLQDAYSPALRQALGRAARAAGISAREGVYLAVSGPSYETPAEIRAFRGLGADLVGMSLVPEVLMARYLGVEVAAISCLTNLAAGLASDRLTHQGVLEASHRSAAGIESWLRRFARQQAEGSAVPAAVEEI